MDEKPHKETYLNLGIVTYIVLLLMLIKDGILFVCGTDIFAINIIIALLAVITLIVVLLANVGAKVKNRKGLEEAISICSAISILLFAIDSCFFELMTTVIDKIALGILLFLLTFLSVSAFVYKVFIEKQSQ